MSHSRKPTEPQATPNSSPGMRGGQHGSPIGMMGYYPNMQMPMPNLMQAPIPYVPFTTIPMQNSVSSAPTSASSTPSKRVRAGGLKITDASSGQEVILPTKEPEKEKAHVVAPVETQPVPQPTPIAAPVATHAAPPPAAVPVPAREPTPTSKKGIAISDESGPVALPAVHVEATPAAPTPAPAPVQPAAVQPAARSEKEIKESRASPVTAAPTAAVAQTKAPAPAQHAPLQPAAQQPIAAQNQAAPVQKPTPVQAAPAKQQPAQAPAQVQQQKPVQPAPKPTPAPQQPAEDEWVEVKGSSKNKKPQPPVQPQRQGQRSERGRDQSSFKRDEAERERKQKEEEERRKREIQAEAEAKAAAEAKAKAEADARRKEEEAAAQAKLKAEAEAKAKEQERLAEEDRQRKIKEEEARKAKEKKDAEIAKLSVITAKAPISTLADTPTPGADDDDDDDEASAHSEEQEEELDETVTPAAIVQAPVWTPPEAGERRIYLYNFIMSFKDRCTEMPADFKLPPELIAAVEGKGKKMPRNPSLNKLRGDGGMHHTGSRGNLAGMGSRGGKKKGGKAPFVMPVDVEPLKNSEDRYKPNKESQNEVEKTMTAPEAQRHRVYREVKGILNKITPETFNKLYQELSDIVLKNTKNIVNEKNELELDSAIATSARDKLVKGVIELMVDKAVGEPAFAVMYARLCQKVYANIIQNDPSLGKKYRREMINQCQEEFSSKPPSGEEFDKLENDAKEVLLAQYKKRQLGVVKFVGELYALELLTYKIILGCLESLIYESEGQMAARIECACKLAITVGERLDNDKLKDKTVEDEKSKKRHPNEYYQELVRLRQADDIIPQRVKFMIDDVMELRDNNWVTERRMLQQTGPKTKDEVLTEAKLERERLNAQAMERTASQVRLDQGMLRTASSNLLPMSGAAFPAGPGPLKTHKSPSRMQLYTPTTPAPEKTPTATNEDLAVSIENVLNLIHTTTEVPADFDKAVTEIKPHNSTMLEAFVVIGCQHCIKQRITFEVWYQLMSKYIITQDSVSPVVAISQQVFRQALAKVLRDDDLEDNPKGQSQFGRILGRLLTERKIDPAFLSEELLAMSQARASHVIMCGVLRGVQEKSAPMESIIHMFDMGWCFTYFAPLDYSKVLAMIAEHVDDETLFNLIKPLIDFQGRVLEKILNNETQDAVLNFIISEVEQYTRVTFAVIKNSFIGRSAFAVLLSCVATKFAKQGPRDTNQYLRPLDELDGFIKTVIEKYSDLLMKYLNDSQPEENLKNQIALLSDARRFMNTPKMPKYIPCLFRALYENKIVQEDAFKEFRASLSPSEDVLEQSREFYAELDKTEEPDE